MARGVVMFLSIGVLALSAFPRTIFSQDITWTNVTEMPWAVGETSAGMLKNANGEPLLLVVGYHLRDKVAQGVTMVLDIYRGTWSRKADRPFRGHHMAAAVVRNKFYLIGGYLLNTPFNMQIYDPLTDTWTVGPPPPYGSGAGCADALGDVIYYCGGLTNGDQRLGAPMPNCSKFDTTTNTWSVIAPMIKGVHHCAMAAANGTVRVIGGRNCGGNHALKPVAFHQLYNPTKNSWTINWIKNGPAALPVGRGGMGGAFWLGGKLYITGGEIACNALGITCPTEATRLNRVGVYDRVDRYDPKTNTWELVPPGMLPAARHGHYPVVGPDPTGTKYVAWHCGGGYVQGYSETTLCQYMSLV